MIKKFEIENINDYVHVQKQVLSTLNAENFFDDEGGKSKTVINKDSGMVIVINKKGIKETFNNKNYFNYSRNLKLAKLASIRKIPELIENGKLILDDEKNYHRNNSSIKYAYIVCETKINGKNANIKITVRKSPQNNKFWVHHIYIEKGTERTSAGTSKSSKTAFIPFGATNSISQSENNVNTKNDESSNDIKYSMGGLKAETADKSALEKAMELEKDGTDSEKIRKETGWFKEYDGKWRFEIDNSELEFKTDIEKNRAAAIELAKMKVKSAEFEEKIVNDTATKAEENVQTMYSGKNKGSLATTPSGKISYSQTSETLSGTASTISLLQENNNVNKKINKITQSRQFVRWFGDWQNKPKTASKVVDGNGEPLVVYHQTGNDFTVFDTKHTGAGEFDSEMPTGIFMKPTNSNIGLSGNKQMALYANICNPFIANSRKELVDFYIKNIDGYSDAKNEVKRIDSEYKQKFQDEMKRENQEYQKLWVARKNGEISEEEYQKAVSRDALDDLLEEWHNKVNEASKKAKSLIDDYFRNSNYDGVIVNNDVGSFGRSTKTYIAFENTQVKSATNNIGTFDGKNPDIRYAIDDTLNDWLDDLPEGIDYEKVVEKNPVVAVAKIYNSASKTAESGLRQSQNVRLEEKDYLRIADKIMDKYGIKGKYNPNYKQELAEQLTGFIEHIGEKGSNFTDVFEEL